MIPAFGGDCGCGGSGGGACRATILANAASTSAWTTWTVSFCSGIIFDCTAALAKRVFEISLTEKYRYASAKHNVTHAAADEYWRSLAPQ